MREPLALAHSSWSLDLADLSIDEAASITKEREFAPGIWAEWPNMGAEVSVQRLAMDSGPRIAVPMVIRVANISRFFRLFVQPQITAGATGLELAITARTTENDLMADLLLVDRNPTAGWQPITSDALRVPVSRNWARLEAVLPLGEVQCSPVLMLQIAADATLYIHEFVATETFDPLPGVRSTIRPVDPASNPRRSTMRTSPAAG